MNTKDMHHHLPLSSVMPKNDKTNHIEENLEARDKVSLQTKIGLQKI